MLLRRIKGFCGCGCGLKIWPGNVFIRGHNGKGIKRPDLSERKGKNHPLFGKKNPDLSERNRNRAGLNSPIFGENNPMKRPEVRAKHTGENSYLFGRTGPNHPRFGKKRPDISKRMKEYMKNGGAAYCNSFIRNPSKPQVKLYHLVKEIFPEAELNYPCMNFSIDVAIPKLKIAIEYDGSYWHQDKEADDKRQMKIEQEGWRFLRYDKSPSDNQLNQDIMRFV